MAQVPDDRLTVFRFMYAGIVQFFAPRVKAIKKDLVTLYVMIVHPNKFITADEERNGNEYYLKGYALIAVCINPEFAWTHCIQDKFSLKNHGIVSIANFLLIASIIFIAGSGIEIVADIYTAQYVSAFRDGMAAIIGILLTRVAWVLTKLIKRRVYYLSVCEYILAYASYKHVNQTGPLAVIHPNEFVQPYAPIQKDELNELLLNNLVKLTDNQPTSSKTMFTAFKDIFKEYQNNLRKKVDAKLDTLDPYTDEDFNALEISYLFLRDVIGLPIEVPQEYAEKVGNREFPISLVKYGNNRTLYRAAFNAYSRNHCATTRVFPHG